MRRHSRCHGQPRPRAERDDRPVQLERCIVSHADSSPPGGGIAGDRAVADIRLGIAPADESSSFLAGGVFDDAAVFNGQRAFTVSDRPASLSREVTGEEAVPELLQLNLTPDNLYRSITEILKNPEKMQTLSGNLKKIKKSLGEKGIGTAVYYPLPLHKMKVFENRVILADKLEQAEKASREVLSLPIEPLLDEKEQSLVCESLKECI